MEEKYKELLQIVIRLHKHSGFCRIGELKQLHDSYSNGYDPVEEFCKALDDLHWFLDKEVDQNG